ncbi:MAG: hypothetical protein AAF772_16560 [Acidobacteriota bacterium]
MDVRAVHARIADFLDGRGVRHAVAGGFALHAYGVSRATYDLDLLVEQRAQAALVDFLEAEGYRTLHRSTGYSNHVHAASDAGRVDVIYLAAPTAEAVLGAADARAITDAWRAPVPRAEHLIALKLHGAAQDPPRLPRDLQDIRDLLVRHRDIDRAAVRQQFAKRGFADLYDRLMESDL